MSTTNQPVLAVLCDVGPRYGVGHLMRCVALAEEFAARGTTVGTEVSVIPTDPWSAAIGRDEQPRENRPRKDAH